jgi:hypothetical protein
LCSSLYLQGDFNGLVEEIFTNFDLPYKDNEYRSITFYGENLNLNIGENITGFSIVSYTPKGLKLETYKINDGQLAFSKDESKQFGNSFIGEILGYYGHKVDNNNNSFVTIHNSAPVAKIYKSGFRYAGDLAILDSYPVIFTYEAARGHYCKRDECNSTNNGFCQHEVSSGSTCEPSSYVEDGGPICPRSDEGETPADGEVQPMDPSLQARAMSALYDIRDNILRSTTKGDQYIDFYYKLGFVFRATDAYAKNRSEMRDLFHFIDVKSLEFVAAGNNDVIINTTEANYLKGLLPNTKHCIQIRNINIL